MKLVSLQHENNLIEVHNNFLTGVETVYFNGIRVAKAFNWFAGVHQFRVENADTMQVDNYRVEFVTSFRKWYGVAIDIFKNGECILNESKRQHNEVFTLTIKGNKYRDYDRSGWYGEPQKEKASTPLYRENDLV